MDEQPLRRSLRVAGMTPLKPMNTILQSEQQQRSRPRSRSSTPRKRQQGSSQAPDSRARQTLNLPSDISSSDFLGDTPTARLYFNRNSRSLDVPTVVAQRINHALLGPQTVKARKINRQSSNVFLTQEEESGMLNVAGLSLFRTVGWVSDSARSGCLWLMTLPILVYQNLNRRSIQKYGFIVGSVAVIAIILYSLMQLDLRMTKSPGGSISRRAVRNSVKPSEAAENPLQGTPEALTGNLNGLKRRIQDIESSVNEARAIFLGSDESIRSNLNSFDSNIKNLSEKESKLESRLIQLSKAVDEIVSKSASSPSSSTALAEIKNLKESVSALDDKLRMAREDIIDLKEQVELEAIRNSIRRELNDLLPEHLAVRKNMDGSLSIDPQLIQSLASILSITTTTTPSFTSKGGAQAHLFPSTASSSRIFENVEGVDGEKSGLDLKIIENMLGGKVSDLEKQIVKREEVLDLLSRKISVEMSKLSLTQKDLRDKLHTEVLGKINQLGTKVKVQESLQEDLKHHLERRISQLDQERLPDDVGMADFALESVGSRVVFSGTSSSYSPNSKGFLGAFFSRTFQVKGPKVALQPQNSIGNCWSFPGSKGHLTIALGTEVAPTHFSLDHLPSFQNIDRSSAPRNFSVYGLEGLRGSETMLLGRYQYYLEGPAVQTFACQFLLTRPLRFIRVEFESNHGKAEYTCLYRFRVHSVEDQNIKNMYEDSQ